MKIKHRNNLIKLIFVHLLLAYPLVSKTFHVHHGVLFNLSSTSRSWRLQLLNSKKIKFLLLQDPTVLSRPI